jgi:UPF0042 nucleotide-binding protein
MSKTDKRQILFITGLSGAGISSALKALEDCGFEVFDNFPLSHMDSILAEESDLNRPIAFGLDTRTRGFDPDQLIITAKKHNARIIFLNATNNELQKRFSETRRVHPMARDRTVTDGIILERKLLDKLMSQSDRMIDTTDLSIHDFKRMITADYQNNEDNSLGLTVTILSFGYKMGVPREVDMMIDVRFLKNPHWDNELKALTGQNAKVQNYINTDENFDVFFKKISDDILWLLPRYAHEGKQYFTIGFGCTGGKHRSVYTTEKMSKFLEENGHSVVTRHRDMPVD